MNREQITRQHCAHATGLGDQVVCCHCGNEGWQQRTHHAQHPDHGPHADTRYSSDGSILWTLPGPCVPSPNAPQWQGTAEGYLVFTLPDGAATTASVALPPRYCTICGQSLDAHPGLCGGTPSYDSTTGRRL